MIEPDEDFRRFQEFFQAIDPKNVDMDEFVKLTLKVLEKLKSQLITASDKEKNEGMALVEELYQTLLHATEAHAEKLGMTEEQLLAFSENSDYFSQEQWGVVQGMKEKINSYGHEIKRALASIPEEAGDKHKSAKEAKKTAKTPRSKWMRS